MRRTQVICDVCGLEEWDDSVTPLTIDQVQIDKAIFDICPDDRGNLAGFMATWKAREAKTVGEEIAKPRKERR